MATDQPTPTASKTESYNSSCHCGKVRMRFTLSPPLLENDICSCNCSACTKFGYLLCYPEIKDVTFVQGEASLKEYSFGAKKKPHRFCGNCGTHMYIDFRESEWEEDRGLYAVNTRTIEGVEEFVDKLKLRKFDGKGKLEPSYTPEF